MKKPLFILGCPRSGTTLLASLLNNTDYGRPVETHFITKYFRKLDSYGDISIKRNLNRLLRDILNERPVMQWKLKVDIDRFYNQLENFTYSEVVNKLCFMMAEKKGFKSWGDKTPRYIFDLDIIYKLFPESKYLYIVRDGRDVALSLMNVPWGPKNIYTCAEYWKKCNADNSTLDELGNSGKFYFLRYEDLLDQSERILPEIYHFLGEDYDQAKIKDLTRRIKKGNYNKWKKRMSPRQVEMFEMVAANTLKRLGYETTYEEGGINGLISNAYRLHEALMKAVFLFRINVIDGIKIKYFGKEPFAE